MLLGHIYFASVSIKNALIRNFLSKFQHVIILLIIVIGNYSKLN